ncbi:hypothetical protein IT157_07705, partial [bacterium]|nr:hypothetical protein [bacterium]
MKPKTLIIIILIVLLGWAAQGLSESRKVASSTTRKQVAQPATGLRVVETSDQRIVLEWAAPQLTIERDEQTNAVLGLDMHGIASDFAPGVPRTPKLTELFDAYEGMVGAQLMDPQYEALNLGECLPMPEDYILDDRNGASNRNDPLRGLDFRERMLRTEKRPGLWPERVVEVVESGVYRGHRLMALHLNPVQINAVTGEGRILKSTRIIVTLPPAPDNQVRLPDSYNETNALKDLLGVLKNTALPTRAREQRLARDSQQGLDDDDFPVWNVNRWKIYVRTTSIVRLTGLYMRSVGIPIGDISPWDLHISHKGREIPIVVEGQEDGNFDEYDYVDFFGERNEHTFIEEVPSMHEDPFTSENCYMMWWGDGSAGLRLGEQDGAWQPSWNAEPVRSVRVTIHLEKDRVFNKLSYADNFLLDELRTGGSTAPMLDHWFFEDYLSAQSSRDYEIFVPWPNRTAPYSFNRVIVRACLTGFSSSYPGWNHYVCVSLNSLSDSGLCYGKQYAGDPSEEWLGQQPAIFETLVPNPAQPDSGVNLRTEDLVSGTNILTVTVPGNPIAGNDDKVLVNWFEIEYERDMRARNGEFRFDFDQPLGDTVSYDVRGFATPAIQVWKLGHSRLTSLETHRVTPTDESASWAVKFPLISDGEYDILAFGENYIFPPFMVIPDTVQIDLKNHSGSEYVVVAFDAFLADTALHMLDSLRRITFNNSVLTVPVSEIYEQFSGGIRTPFAIHDFMQYAYDNWSVRPTHLCLVGDAVTERLDDDAVANQIPTFTPFTEDYGVAPADYLYGCVSGAAWDVIPDIAVGRISCRTPQELATYVQKLILYESAQDFEGLFQSNLLLIADHTDSRGNRFGTDYSEITLDRADPCMNITRVYLDSIPSGQGPIKLRDALRDGAVVANYNGH